MIAISILSALLGIFTGIGIWIVHNNRHPKKMPSLTKYVAFSIAVLIVYTVAELVLATRSGITHDSLTTCVFACFGGEILSCALIKIFKLKEENNDADG
jgi:prepilin signal peptidase PulO-like enzyme (type II secretory pathway)